MVASWTTVSANFVPGMPVTSYGSQGKTVDYVLFPRFDLKTATNAQQWYVPFRVGGVASAKSSHRTKPATSRECHALGHRHWQWNFATALFRADACCFGIGCTLSSSFRSPSRRQHLSSKNGSKSSPSPTQKHEHKVTRKVGPATPQTKGLRIEVSPERSLLLPARSNSSRE